MAFQQPKRKAIQFSQARLEYIDEGNFLFFKGNLKLCFMKDKMEVACIREGSRGFSKEVINEMIEKAKDYNLPSGTF
jgi:hypothetical protein